MMKPKLIYNGHYFSVDRCTEKSVSWECCVRSCKSRCATNPEKTAFVRLPSTHGCNSQKSVAEEAGKVFNEIANENIMSKPSAILTKFQTLNYAGECRTREKKTVQVPAEAIFI